MIILPKAQWTSQPKYPPRINWAHPATAQLVRAGAATSKRDLVTNAPLTTALIEPGTGGNLISRVGTTWAFSYATGDEWTVPTNGSLTILAAVPKTRTTTWGGIWRTGPLSNGGTLFNVATSNGFAQIRIGGTDVIPATVGPQVPQGEQVYIAFRSSSGTGAEAAVFWNGEQKRTAAHARTLSGVTINNVGGQFALTDGLGDLAAYWVWNRRLSDSELVALTQNPWQLYQPQRFIFPLQSAAANAYSLDTTPGSYALTGSSATTLYDRLVDTTAGSYSLTGSSATTLYDRLVDTTAGSYSLTGSSATTLYDRLVDTTAGSYTLTGVSATLDVVAALTLDTTPGSYTLTGSSATLEYVAALELDTTPGSYTLTGSSATTLYNRLVDTTAGSYSLTGSSATALYGRLIDTTAGSYTLTGSSATTLYNRLVDTTPGIYSLTGSPAELIASAGVSVNVTGVSGTGNVGTVSVAISINALVTGIAGISSIGAVTVSVTSNPDVNVTGVVATGYVGSPLVWGPVDDGQTPNWVIVDDSHSASWTQVLT
jgi:hypothetical protein